MAPRETGKLGALFWRTKMAAGRSFLGSRCSSPEQLRQSLNPSEREGCCRDLAPFARGCTAGSGGVQKLQHGRGLCQKAGESGGGAPPLTSQSSVQAGWPQVGSLSAVLRQVAQMQGEMGVCGSLRVTQAGTVHPACLSPSRTCPPPASPSSSRRQAVLEGLCAHRRDPGTGADPEAFFPALPQLQPGGFPQLR